MGKISFDEGLAKEVGLNAAIIHERLHDLCAEKARNNVDYHDGSFWVRIPQKKLPELFPYMPPTAVLRAMKKLTDGGYVLVGHYDEDHNSTNWYAAT